MLSLCWRNTSLNIHRFDVATRQTMAHLLRYSSLRYHVQYYQHQQQQKMFKHTQAETLIDDNTSSTSANNSSKTNHMKATATTSTSSSVFAPYSKEESYQKMQLKNLQQQTTATTTLSSSSTPSTSPTEKPITKATTSSTITTATPAPPVAAASTATTETATNPVHIPYNIDWIFKRLKNPNGLWYICSQIVIFAVGFFSKIVLDIKTSVWRKLRKGDLNGQLILCKKGQQDVMVHGSKQNCSSCDVPKH